VSTKARKAPLRLTHMVPFAAALLCLASPSPATSPYAQPVPCPPASYFWAPALSTNGSVGLSWFMNEPSGTLYDVDEDASPAFAAPVRVYSGTDLSCTLVNKPNGTYYYRLTVSACYTAG
jgi:hypothetical protein